jgi:signal transduction histidine kinase
MDGPLWMDGDENELERVVANLLDNAVRHARSSVRVSALVTGSHAVVTVVDDGPGVPEADRERVFDRFTRLDDARARDAGGAGLGLSIVRELVRRHGGAVTLADANPGLRVDVRLPLTSG